MKIIGARWFNFVGIVRVEDPYKGIKYYIKNISSVNEEADMKDIADWGSTFPNDAGDVLFGVKKEFAE
jgi:hypothetical protein